LNVRLPKTEPIDGSFTHCIMIWERKHFLRKMQWPKWKYKTFWTWYVKLKYQNKDKLNKHFILMIVNT
jgi:hypothetical protein